MLLRVLSRLARPLALLLAAHAAAAQSVPTAEQLRMLERMSPAERAAIVESLQKPAAPALSAQPAAPAGASAPALPATLEAQPAEARVQGDDTLVIDATLRKDADKRRLEAFTADANRARILGSRSYRLDKDGVLALPGIATIPLAGLTAEEVAVRLEAEPLLDILDIGVTLLPLTPIGPQALKPFGYSMFQSRPDLFAAGSNIAMPVPADYVIGPGDTLRIQLFGGENYEIELPVTPDGSVNLPKLGPQPVAGMSFERARASLEKRVSEQLIGTQASVTMGRLRSVRVFVVGDVKRPGAYELSSLARMTTALAAAGGITEVGSLRNVTLKRAGKAVKTLDLYALLLRGDTRNDAQLVDGDVVLVPPAGPMAGVDGEVKRPAIYEFGSEGSLGEIIALAGGLQPTADRRRVQLERISASGARTLETIDLTAAGADGNAIRAGDTVRVPPVLDDVEGAVTVEGNVTRPGSYQWFAGMTLTDLLPSAQSLKPRTDLGYVLVRRESGAGRRTSVLSADLGAAQAARHGTADIALRPRDIVTVFEIGIARSAAVDAVLRDLEAQASREEPLQRVSVSGAVRASGSYPLEPGMRVADLVRAGGGLAPSAFPDQAELTRFVIDDKGERTTQLLTVDLAAARAGDEAANLSLGPYDVLTVKSVPAWKEQVSIELRGEFRFPGTYTVRRGETLSSVITRAGGFTELAFPEGSVFTREFLKEREAQQIETLARRLESDIATLAVQTAQLPDSKSAEALSVGRSLLQQLRNTIPTGRLVIDLPKLMANAGDPHQDVTLREGDVLVVPMRSEEVTVLGEVQYATSHRFDPVLARDDYIAQSGDLTPRADGKRIYVVRANGAVIADGTSAWFRDSAPMKAGDSIVVPLDTQRLPTLAQWSSITQIIYNLAIAVAAVNSF